MQFTYISTFVLNMFLVKLLSFRSCRVQVALQVGRLRVRFQRVSLEFFIDIDCGTGVDTTSNRNEYEEYFLGGKAAGA